MKKVLTTLILINLLAVFLLPSLTLAQTGVPETCKLKRDFTNVDPACTKDSSVNIERYGICCLFNTLYNITDWIFLILVALAGLFVIIGAMTLMTAAGDPTKVASGRNYILYAMVGLLVAFLAKAVPSIVRMIMGAG